MPTQSTKLFLDDKGWRSNLLNIYILYVETFIKEMTPQILSPWDRIVNKGELSLRKYGFSVRGAQ
jgi:hypothetical protein